MSTPVQVLKIGGSIITEKEQRNTFARTRTVQLVKHLSNISNPLVVVHGTGSFGKPPAQEYGFEDGFLSADQRAAFLAMEDTLDVLRDRVREIFRDTGCPGLSIRPAGIFQTSGGTVSQSGFTGIRALLRNDIIPILSGGFVPDRQGGYAVLSSDQIAVHLAIHIQAKRLVFASDTPGLLDYSTDPPTPVEKFTIRSDAIEKITRPSKRDISGGMRAKLQHARRAVNAGIATYLVDGRKPQRVTDLLRGRQAHCTELFASEPPPNPSDAH